MKVGRVTLSDRASAGIYEDRSGPEIERVFGERVTEPVEWVRVIIPDERVEIEAVQLLARYRAAFPRDYEAWRRAQGLAPR